MLFQRERRNVPLAAEIERFSATVRERERGRVPQRENDAEIQRNSRRLNGTIARDMQFTSCDGLSELARRLIQSANSIVQRGVSPGD